MIRKGTDTKEETQTDKHALAQLEEGKDFKEPSVCFCVWSWEESVGSASGNYAHQ